MHGRHGIDQARYQIRVRGHLGAEWSHCFAGMAVTNEPGGETLLGGWVADQAALHGILGRVRDMGLVLVAVVRTEEEAA